MIDHVSQPEETKVHCTRLWGNKLESFANQSTGSYMTLAFYIVMGDFAMKIERADRSGMTKTDDTVHLAKDKVLELIESKVTSPMELDQESIKDRSKADLFSKFVLCLQASWIILQCIGRGVNSIPLTLLEVNTVMHVVYTLLIYVLWWKKPQDSRICDLHQ